MTRKAIGTKETTYQLIAFTYHETLISSRARARFTPKTGEIT